MSKTTDLSDEIERPNQTPVIAEESATTSSNTVSSDEMLSDGGKNSKGFWKGFWICIGLNILLGLMAFFAVVELVFLAHEGKGFPAWYLSVIWLTTNLLVFVLLIANRRKTAGGFLTGFAVALMISLVAGVFISVACWGG